MPSSGKHRIKGLKGLTLRQYLGAKPRYEDRLLRGWSQVCSYDRQRTSERRTTLLFRQRIEAKLKSGTDVLRAPEEPAPAEATNNVIDLMQVLKGAPARTPAPSIRPPDIIQTGAFSETGKTAQQVALHQGAPRAPKYMIVCMEMSSGCPLYFTFTGKGRLVIQGRLPQSVANRNLLNRICSHRRKMMTNQNQWSFPMLAVSLAMCLPSLVHAQVSATEPAARNMAEMKFGPIPPLPTCASGSVQNGDPAKGAFIVAIKLTTGCSLPWHWHTAGEYLMIVSGTGRMEMKDGPSQTIGAGSYVQLPSRHVHQFLCKDKCTFFFYSDGAWDMHYVDPQGTEISPDEALKAVKEKAAK